MERGRRSHGKLVYGCGVVVLVGRAHHYRAARCCKTNNKSQNRPPRHANAGSVVAEDAFVDLCGMFACRSELVCNSGGGWRAMLGGVGQLGRVGFAMHGRCSPMPADAVIANLVPDKG